MRLHLQPYALALRQPWHSAREILTERRGWLVVAEDDTQQGYGDCAPLPAAGTETLAEAEPRLAYWQARALQASPATLLDELTAALPSATPAADAAVECALLDGISRAAGIPLRAQLLTAAAGREQIPVNGALGALIDCRPETLAAPTAAGFRVLKLKVGTAPPAEEIASLRRLLPVLPEGTRLRLDANGAWDFDTASEMLRMLAQLEAGLDAELNAGRDARPRLIESLEEPLRVPQDAALVELQARTVISLALDESLPHRPWPILASALPVRRIVIKPPVLGGLRPSLALATAARDAGIETVITSLIDSAAGLWASAQIAAAVATMNAERPTANLCPELCHGLATADWLRTDLGETPLIRNGTLHLGTMPGSGFVPLSPA